ncbi:hypothetical protein [Chitinophaga sancti]|uniref:Uncharacterized protein n=1 Tax=Chitinophaga sancti TaxID=1004 RepID=A0A1K1SUX0_9BACT|nr:hypothetical protein [Chitinophaga sancti]WQD63793.1 hypothetical protein U0033_05245 [Chitinophaga sancti]WQG90582.1 hypothetical protein SR876_03675 [Chitinophaga sancti]SFW88106.1 hypothetical protein SAMN05661012_06193 [Chitinophaga sancti]
MMTWEEFRKTREFIEGKSLALMKHETKDAAKTGFPINNYSKYLINGRTFYCIKSNVFKAIIEDYYFQAHKKFPEKFETGNALDVIDAIYLMEPTFDLERFIDFLKNEQFAYIIESKDGEIANKILRIDLFRQLDTNKEGKMEFTGGIFHTFKHFSIDNLNLSTGKDIHNIQYPEQIIHLAAEAFFIAEGTHENPKKLVSKIDLDDKYRLKFVFYLEENTQVYFIKTIHKEPK